MTQGIERRGTRVVGQPTSRAIARLEEQTDFAVAVVEASAVVQAAKVDAVGFVAQRAMYNVAYLSQIEQQLGELSPIACSRLQAIGGLATLGMGQIVTDTVTRLRSY